MNAPSRPALLAVLGMLALVFVTWAAAAPRGDWAATARDGLFVRHRPGTQDFVYETGCANCLAPVFGPRARTSDLLAAVLGWAVLAVMALMAAISLALALQMLLAHLIERDDRSVPADDAVDLDLEAVSEAVATGTPQRLDALSAGTPAEGIIAAWSHLEATLHESGLPLPSSRTSTEVSLDLLGRFSVDRATVGSLAGLYREARWSHHALTEDDRSRAASAYRRLEATLRPQMPGANR